MKNIGFIGVGTMGLPMALNLVKNGHLLSFYDPFANEKTIQTLTEVGAKQNKNIADLCNGKDFVISMLPIGCLLYTSPSPRDRTRSRMPSSA